MREGLGIATNNVAEYRGFILGLKYALAKGFTSVRVRGDSKLVCMQVCGLFSVFVWFCMYVSKWLENQAFLISQAWK